MLSKTVAGRLAGFETPFYLYDTALLRRTIREAKRQAERYGYRIHYALKANFDERLLGIILAEGLGVDCVSGNEVRRAVESGFDPAGIVYAGVGKTDAEIRYAIGKRIMAFNCESRQELEVIDALAAEAGRRVDVALRINPDIDPHTHANISTGQADSKFGISYTEIDEVMADLGSLSNLRIVGLHFHIGSQILDMEVFENLCSRVNAVVAWFRGRGLELEHVNVGGGLGIDYDDPDAHPVADFADYFGRFAKTLDVGDLQVHFELGRSLIGQCGELITRVLFNKTTATGRRVVVVDASMTDLIRPALYHARHRIVNLTPRSARLERCMVAGTVCESSDVFDLNAELSDPQRGDLLAIASAGAYGMSMASRYNLHSLPGAVYGEELQSLKE